MKKALKLSAILASISALATPVYAFIGDDDDGGKQRVTTNNKVWDIDNKNQTGSPTTFSTRDDLVQRYKNAQTSDVPFEIWESIMSFAGPKERQNLCLTNMLFYTLGKCTATKITLSDNITNKEFLDLAKSYAHHKNISTLHLGYGGALGFDQSVTHGGVVAALQCNPNWTTIVDHKGEGKFQNIIFSYNLLGFFEKCPNVKLLDAVFFSSSKEVVDRYGDKLTYAKLGNGERVGESFNLFVNKKILDKLPNLTFLQIWKSLDAAACKDLTDYITISKKLQRIKFFNSIFNKDLPATTFIAQLTDAIKKNKGFKELDFGYKIFNTEQERAIKDALKGTDVKVTVQQPT